MSDDVVVYLSLEECVAIEAVTSVTQWSSLDRIPQELYGVSRTAGNDFSKRDEVNAVRKLIRAHLSQGLMLGPFSCPT